LKDLGIKGFRGYAGELNNNMKDKLIRKHSRKEGQIWKMN